MAEVAQDVLNRVATVLRQTDVHILNNTINQSVINELEECLVNFLKIFVLR